MNKMPTRDITGKCEGECKDIVFEAEKKFQKELNKYGYSGGESPSVDWAKCRDASPGFLGGHV